MHAIERNVEIVRALCPECVEKQRSGLGTREEDDELSDRCYDEEEGQDSLGKTRMGKVMSGNGKGKGKKDGKWKGRAED